jgi:hypothetical protein
VHCAAIELASRARRNGFAHAETGSVGAVYWSGVRRVGYALAAAELNFLVAVDPDEPLLDLPCHRVFEAGGSTVNVSGPYLYEDAAAVHAGYWGWACTR